MHNCLVVNGFFLMRCAHVMVQPTFSMDSGVVNRMLIVHGLVVDSVIFLVLGFILR